MGTLLITLAQKWLDASLTWPGANKAFKSLARVSHVSCHLSEVAKAPIKKRENIAHSSRELPRRTVMTRCMIMSNIRHIVRLMGPQVAVVAMRVRHGTWDGLGLGLGCGCLVATWQ